MNTTPSNEVHEIVDSGLRRGGALRQGGALDRFEVASGSVAGREHARVGRNNQDACVTISDGENLVAVVADGCSSRPHSEVGARLGARVLAATLARHLRHTDAGVDEPRFWAAVQEEVLGRLDGLARSMTCGDEGAGGFLEVVADHLLFTVVAAVVTPRWTALVHLGDGFLVINGERIAIGPYADNAPPYLGYALLDGAGGWRPEQLRLSPLRLLPTDEVRSILLGSDGVADLDTAVRRGEREREIGSIGQFWSDDRYFVNADALRRRLFQINRPLPRVLADDTTLVVIRRRRRGDA